MTALNLTSEGARAALQRVLASPEFVRAPAQSKLLRYIVEKGASGQPGDLKEYTIALEVFDRPSYDPQVDSFVRVEVGKLRKRLERYYDSEGRGDPVQIEIPKGSYVPAIRQVGQTQPPPRTRLAFRGMAAAAVLIALTAVAAWVSAKFDPVTGSSGTLVLAVLPFDDVSPAKEGKTFADGLTGELTTRLASIEAMRVISRTMISTYERGGIDVHSLRKELNVHALMEGSVRVEATHVRVIAQLTDTTDGSPLWTSTFEYDKAALSDAARDLAGKIVRSFEIELKPIRRALIRPHSHVSAARHYYMRAARTGYSEPLKGVELYRAAVSVDPNYALAWAALALSLVTAADWGEVRMGDALPEASAAARRALGLNPSMTEAHQAMARVKVFQQQDWSGAERLFLKAIELDPSNVEARHDYSNLVLIPTARFMDAVSQLNKAVALNPGENTLYNAMASAYVKDRQFDKALAPLEASQRISRDAPGAWVLRGIIAMGQNNLGEAVGHFERAASRRRTAFALSHLAYAYARSGRHEESRKVIEEMEQLATGKASYNYEIAMIHAGLGDTAGAFAALARAAAEHEQGLLWMNVDYRSDGLRDDPEFHTLLKKVCLK